MSEAYQTKGFGAARKPSKTGPQVDRYCISPQLAPSVVTPASRKLFMQSEDYHKDTARK